MHFESIFYHLKAALIDGRKTARLLRTRAGQKQWQQNKANAERVSVKSGVGGGIVGASTSPAHNCLAAFIIIQTFFRSANATFCDIGIVVSVMMVLVAIIRGNAGVVCGGFGVSKVK